MKTYTYKNCDSLLKVVTDLTFENIKSGRIHHKEKGWISFKFKDYDTKINIFKEIAKKIGGKDISAIIRGLHNLNYHWAFERFIYNKNYGWQYYAGQDQSYEMKQLRKILYLI